MNKYLAFYKNKKIEVEAETSLEAWEKAVKIFKARKHHMVHVYLAQKDGEEVVHVAVD